MSDRERVTRSSLLLVTLGLTVAIVALVTGATAVQGQAAWPTYALDKTITYPPDSTPGVAVSEIFTVTLVFQNYWTESRLVHVQDNNPNAQYLRVLSQTITSGAYYVPQFDAIVWKSDLGIAEPVTVTFQVRVIGGANKKVTNFAWLDDTGTPNTSPDAQDWAEIVIKPDAPILDPIDNQDGDGDYTVRWKPVTGAVAYTLEVADNSDFASSSVLYTGANTQYSVIHQGLGSWYYRVRATGSWAVSHWSNMELTEVLLAAPVLAPIDNPEANSSYVVAWSPVTGATLYTLEEDDDPGFGSQNVAYEGPLTQKQITGRERGTWYYRVRASNASGRSSWSQTQSTTVGEAGPTYVYLAYVPRNWPPVSDTPFLQPIGNPDGDGAYTINWGLVQSAANYVLEEAASSTFADATQVYAGTATSYSVAGNGAARYYYRVKARNAWGDSRWSNTQSVDVLWEAEVNDFAPQQANGPIVSGLTYFGTFPSGGDINDYYCFDLPAAGRVELWLRNIPAGHNFDLVLRDLASLQDPYRTPPGYSGNVGNLDEHIVVDALAPARYWIQVHNRSRLGSSQPYHLQVTY